ncbi:MAG TPA: ABC transporter permease subunit, partial [Phytomonospora sp.]
ALMIVLVALLAGVSGDRRDGPPVPVGPGGEPVADSFFFVHRSLTGDGGITVAVEELTTVLPAAPGVLEPGVVPWSKAGLIIKRSTDQGASYAAIMLTGGHGVRMQHDFLHDTGAGPARWLRLERSGDVVTGYASADGARWTEVGTARLDGLGATVHAGLFVASPPSAQGMGTRGSVSTGVFTGLDVQGDWGDGDWTGTQIGGESPTFAGYPPGTAGSFAASGGSVSVTGAGDIAPAVRDTLPTGGTLKDILTGAFAALIAIAVVAALFIAGEYRRRLVHVTLAASPGRGGVLAAKAIVVGTAAFAAGFAGTVVAAPLGEALARADGVHLFPVTTADGLRVALGTAALLAIAAVLALSVGAILRHAAGAVAVVVVLFVLPYVLVANPFTPASAADWLARVTPAAAFAVQQTLEPYAQAEGVYTPYNGYFPLEPWAGLAVLAAWAAVGLVSATALLRGRDA